MILHARITSTLVGLALVLTLAGAGESALAANKFVRAGASGAGTGNNWTDAYASTAAITWTAGNTYWVAGGTYSGFTIGAGNLSIKRATAANPECTGAAGWSAGFDSQVIITSAAVDVVTWFQSDVTMDGQVSNGIRIKGTGAVGTAQGSCIYLIGHRNTLRYLDLETPRICSQWFAGVKAGSTAFGKIMGNTITRCNIHGGTQCIFIAWNGDTVVEYSELHDNYQCLGVHNNVCYVDTATNFTFRYNYVHDYSVEGLYFTPFGQGTDYLYVYGNIFESLQAGGSGRGIEFDPNSAAAVVGPHIYVYNNTFNMPDLAAIRASNNRGYNGISGINIRNNIFYGNGFNTGPCPRSDDYNWFQFADAFSALEAHPVVGNGANPFVNLGAHDYHILGTVSSTMPRAKGVNLGAPYNVDRDGVTQTVPGPWDIGAYVFPTGQILPNQPSNVTPINGATGQSLTPTLTLNAFSGPNPHVNSQFQVLQGASVIWNSGAVAPSVSWTVPDGTLTASTSYSWQGRYANLSGWSSYSTPTTFTTAAVPATPTNVAPANGATDQSFTPTLQLSAYSGALPQTGAQFIVRLAGDEIWNSGTLGVVNSVVVPDGNLESNQTYSFQGRFQSSSGWSGYSVETTFTTTNTAPTGTIQWEVSGYSVPEAGPSVVLTATRTGGTKGILASPWATANGTATAGHDYTASSGTVTFAAGNATPQTTTIPILNSGDFDTQNRTFTVTLTGTSLGTPTIATVTIEMNPPPPIGGIGWTTATYQTAYNAGSKDVLAYRFGGDFGAVGASYSTLDGTAQAGRDYTAKSGTVSFANGVTNAVTISITILNSGQTSTLPRYFFVNLSNPTGGAALSGVSSAMVAIDMPPPTVPPSVLIIQNPSSVIFQGGVIVTNR